MSFTVKSKNDIISDILLAIFDNVDDITDANVGGVMRQMVEAIAEEISLLYDNLQTIFDGSRIDTSTGTDLEQLGKIVGIERKTGTKASGNATFIRRTPAGADFTISSGNIISTQPNTGEEQLKFSVTTATTFSATITDELNTFVDGIFDYRLNERLIDSISSLKATVLTVVDTPLTEATDFDIISDVDLTIIDPDTVVLLDDCDTADFTESTDATAEVLNTVTFQQGTSSLDLGKSGTASDTASYEKILSPVVDGNGKKLYVWVEIIDSTALSKIKEIKLTVGSGGSALDSFSTIIPSANLTTGFQQLELDTTVTTTTKTGIPLMTIADFIKLDIITNNATDVLTSGDVKMDFWIFADSERFIGDIIRFDKTGTLPDDSTSFKTTYIPLSKEVPVESDAVGTKFNIGLKKLIFKVSNITSIDSVNNFIGFTNGTDLEADDPLRERIKFATELKGKATVESLKQALLAINGITSANIEDLPFNTKSDEPHIFDITVDTYKLDFEIAIDDATLKISNTFGGSADYTKGVDYVLTSESEIKWLSGSKPLDGDTFYVTYNYNWLGHVNAFIAGTTAPLPAPVLADVSTAIIDTKAAGITVSVSEPTIVTTDIVAEISVDSAGGFSFSSVKTSVETALESFMKSLEIGKNIFVSEIIQEIMNVSGVTNTILTTPATDIVIAADEVGRNSGTITITEI